ncbi:MAG TPA: iron-sulfur cluster assembly accessory protein [Oscillatoriaceae cyanobacterium]
MTVENTPKTKSLITLTPSAIAHVKTLLERQGVPGHYLRVAVSGGGCSGMSYKLSTEAEPGPNDKVVQCDDLQVLVDKKSMLYLAGLELDYSDDLMNAGFKFTNPNAKVSCGCGTSFST